jgi:hypothetical protein
MRSNFILLVIGVIGLAILLYFVSPLSRTEAPPKEVSAEDTVDETPTAPVIEDSKTKTPAVKPAVPVAKSDEPKPIDPAIMKIFSQKLRDLGTCLETQNSVPGDELEPSLQTVVDSVRGEWGESVINTEDWMQVEMETPEGEKRRIRVETDFDSETQVQRKLKYMSIAKDGTTTTPIPVPEDQAVEPSESLIASLETGNKILQKENFERIYFQNGEEIVAKQRDGMLTELEVNKGPKGFKCTNLTEESASCQCVQ